MAARLGRRFVGFEMETEYLELGRQRMEDENSNMPKNGVGKPQQIIKFCDEIVGGGGGGG